MYLDRLISYIDQSVPVIAGRRDSVFVGYEDYGKTLLYITGNSAIPESILLEKEIYEEADEMEGWTFVGAKKRTVRLWKFIAKQLSKYRRTCA